MGEWELCEELWGWDEVEDGRGDGDDRGAGDTEEYSGVGGGWEFEGTLQTRKSTNVLGSVGDVGGMGEGESDGDTREIRMFKGDETQKVKSGG